MRATLLRALAFLAAGAVLTTLVAWGCAYFIVDRTFDATLLGRLRKTAFGADQENYLAFVFVGLGSQTLVIHDNGDVIHQHSAGWPWHSMIGEQRDSRVTLPPRRYVWSVDCHRTQSLVFPPLIQGAAGAAGVPIFPARRTNALLPMRPIWHTFAADSVLMGAGLWVFSLMLVKARQAIRRWAGRCAACGYPVGASAVCTECGRDVKARRAAQR